MLNEIIKEKVIFGDLLSKVSGNYKDMSKLLSQDTALQVIEYLLHFSCKKKEKFISLFKGKAFTLKLKNKN